MSAKIIFRHASHASFYELTAYDCRRQTEFFGIKFDETAMNLLCKVANDMAYEEKLTIYLSGSLDSFGLILMGEYHSRTFLVECSESGIDLTLFQPEEMQRTQFNSADEMIIEGADDVDNLVVALSKSLWK